MRKNTINKTKDLIAEAIKSGLSVTQVCRKRGKGRNFVANNIWSMNELLANDSSLLDHQIVRQIKTVLELYDEYKVMVNGGLIDKQVKRNTSPNKRVYKNRPKPDINCINDVDIDSAYDERSSGFALRGDEVININHSTGEYIKGTTINKIIGYQYNILVRGEEPLVGELTREEMDKVYQLYSNMDGAGLTQRSVSRQFPTLTFRDFKRILRAFNITKSSIPVAPHRLEEMSEDDLINIIWRNKENSVFKKIEDVRAKETEKLLGKAYQEISELKSRFSSWQDLFSSINLSEVEPFRIKKQFGGGDKALVVYLSDQHVGAHTKEDSLYNNVYNEQEFASRMNRTLAMIQKQFELHGRFDSIIVCNLGDCVDGYNGHTTRGGHHLPQNMDNRVQFKVYTSNTIKFFESLHNMDVSNSVSYYSVGEDNHSGDFGYMANYYVKSYLNLRFPDMVVDVHEKFIDSFQYGSHTYIISHGKDKEDMKGGFPLALNEKTENYFNNYINRHRIRTPYIHVVCGDLHQTTTQYAKQFRWRRVLSMYGASKWIHTNFGYSRAGLDYEVIEKNSEEISEGRIWFN